MSRTFAYRNALPEGAPPYDTDPAVPVYQFNNPYRPTEEFIIPEYSRVAHPCSFPVNVNFNSDKLGELSWAEWIPQNGFEYNLMYSGNSADIAPSPVWDGLQAYWNFPPEYITPPSTPSRIYALYVWGPDYDVHPRAYGPEFANFLIQFRTGPLMGYTRRIVQSDWVDDEAINPNGDLDLYYIDVDPPFPTAPNPNDTFDILFDVFRYQKVVIQLSCRIFEHSLRSTAIYKPRNTLIALADVPPGNPPSRPSHYYVDEYSPMKIDNRFTIPTYISTAPPASIQPFNRDANTAYDAVPVACYIVDVSGALGLKIRSAGQTEFTSVWGSGV